MLTLENISKTFGTKQVLKSVSFSLHKGESVLLLGANGAGKTTVLQMLMENVKPTDGSIHWHQRNTVGFVLQDASLMDRVTVKELIKWTRSLYASPLSYKEALEGSGLVGMENAKTEDLSVGQKRKLHFSLALVGQPDLLIMDEPTAGMDVHSRKQVYRQISDLKSKGITILMTTHVLEEASFLGDRVLFLEDGEVTTNETIESLEDTTSWVRLNLGRRDQRIFLKKKGFSWNDLLHQWEIETNSPDDCVRWLVEHRIDFRDLSVQKRTIESYYEEWTSDDRPNEVTNETEIY